jgi:peptidyl-prolyl cis-trans isomerase SurA
MRTLASILVLLAICAPGATLDRVSARVGKDAITDSALRRHLRMEAFFSGKTPDLGSASRRKAAERLIDQLLIRRELELNRFAPPSAADVEAQLEQLMKARQEDAAALGASLESYGFSLDDLRSEIQYQLMLLHFVDFRFSAGVLVSDAEIQEEYEKEIVPQAQQRNAPPPSAEDARPEIVRLLTYRKTNAALEQWLALARQQVKIQIFEEAFR